MDAKRKEERAADGRNGEESGIVVAAVGSAAATQGTCYGCRASHGEDTSSGNTPSTPTVEELLKATEVGARSGREITAASESAMMGRFTATPVLRTAAVEPW